MAKTFSQKYLPSNLTKKDKEKVRRYLKKSRKLYKQKSYYTRPKVRSFKSIPSKHVRKAFTTYKISSMKPSRELSQKTGCSRATLKHIIRKGKGAYYSSGSRPNQTAHSWAFARLASAITGGPASIVDYKELQSGCLKKSTALTLADASRQKY